MSYGYCIKLGLACGGEFSWWLFCCEVQNLPLLICLLFKVGNFWLSSLQFHTWHSHKVFENGEKLNDVPTLLGFAKILTSLVWRLWFLLCFCFFFYDVSSLLLLIRQLHAEVGSSRFASIFVHGSYSQGE